MPRAAVTTLYAPSAGHGRDARLAWVDGAKGLCIVLVVMMHSVIGVEDALGTTGWLHPVVAFATPFRIPAFFLLAGLFLSRGIETPWAQYLDRKLVHFAYFYLLWAALQIALKTGIPLGLGPALHAYTLALVEPFGTLWFIYLLPLFFIVTKALRRVPVIILLGVAAALEILPIHTGSTLIDEFASRYVWFLAGAFGAPWIFAWADVVRSQKATALLLIGTLGTMNGLLVAGHHAGQPGISLLLGLSGALGLIAVAVILTDTWAGRIVREAGRHSIIIYLAFFLPMIGLRVLLVQSGAAVTLGAGTTGLLVWTGAAIIPLLMHPLALQFGLRFLFERPAWARYAPSQQPRLEPAE
ncbi:MAG: acyltransferase family protein [Beijerinckiaceae bacterium]